MKYLFQITFLFLSAFSCLAQSIKDLEKEKYLNYVVAIKEFGMSTANYYIVITVKNFNTNEVKEICTRSEDLIWALESEGFTRDSAVAFASLKKDRYFQFKSLKALTQLSFNRSNISILDTVLIKYNFKEIGKTINKHHTYCKDVPNRYRSAFAHILFNMGYLTSDSGCEPGPLCYVNRRKIKL